jgi:hypothetical protein
MRSRSLKIGWTALIILIALSTVSCEKESCEDTGSCPELGIVERTDLVFTGDFTYSDFQKSTESNTTFDLVTFRLDAIPTNEITFRIHLANGNILEILVHNDHNINPWEHAGIDYGIHPDQDLEDKWKYVTARYLTGSDASAYSSNLGVNIPPGSTLNVFQVTAYDGTQIRCRIQDMVLYKNIDPSSTIEVDGTFIAAATFLQ